jgi:hypothetical protein
MNRKRVGCSLEESTLVKLNKLSEETKIQKTRLIELAILRLFENYQKEGALK